MFKAPVVSPACAAPSSTSSPTTRPASTVTELWFDSRESFDAAYASDRGRRAAEDSLAHVSRRERLFVDERPLV
jgi:hypothetical protein